MIYIIKLFIGGFLSGSLLKKIRIPGGMMIGSLIFSVVYVNYIGEYQEINFNLSLISQVLAGVCIGAKIVKEDLIAIKNIYKEIILINVGLLIITITCGVVLHYGFHLTMSDAFFGSIPGGMTSIPLIAMEYGANPVNVTLLQFVRLIVGVGLFPKMIVNHLGLNSNVNLENKEQKVSRKKSYHWERELDEWKKTLLTLMITFISVIILEQINFPLGTLVIAILVSALYNVVTNKGHVKEELYSVAQLFLGTYIGSVVKIGDIPAIHTLILPIIAVAIVFTVGSFLLGMFLKKFTSFTETEAYFSAIPAGAADLGLITHELGIFSSKIIVVQVARVLIVTSIFPPILNIIINLL